MKDNVGSHRVRKLVNFSRFAFGPSVDKVFKIGLTLSAALGLGNVTKSNELV